MPTLHDLQDRARRAVALFLDARAIEVEAGLHVPATPPHASGIELLRLADTLGMDVIASTAARRARAAPSTVIGPGRIQELHRALHADDAPEFDVLLVDAELTPRQHHHLTTELECTVMDRTAVILEIFEQRARTREAQLEVELARLRFEMPRMRATHSDDDRRGGGGRGERGHTNVELARSRARDRVAQLTRELEELQRQDDSRRQRRADAWTAALVGYTNAGKSSLMRALCGADVLAEDRLFATVGTTVRQLAPATDPPILVSDTVGFIQHLPHELVASFRSTLEEARLADLLLLVVDASDPDHPQQLECVKETLADILEHAPEVLLILHKSDALGEDESACLQAAHPDALLVSAHTPASVAALREKLIQTRDATWPTASVLIPWAESARLGALRKLATVIEETHEPDGTRLVLRGPRHVLEGLELESHSGSDQPASS